MALVRLVEHGTEVTEMAGVPTEVTVVAHRIGDAHNGLTHGNTRRASPRWDASTRWRASSWERNFAAIGEGRRAVRVLTLREGVQRSEERAGFAGTVQYRRQKIDLIGDRPERHGKIGRA